MEKLCRENTKKHLRPTAHGRPCDAAAITQTLLIGKVMAAGAFLFVKDGIVSKTSLKTWERNQKAFL